MNIMYEKRRKDVLDWRNCYIAMFHSGKAPVRSADERYPFSVNRNFYYLTGLDLEDCILMIIRDMNGGCRCELFADQTDDVAAKWNGGTLDRSQIASISGISSIFPMKDWAPRFHRYINNIPSNYSTNVGLDLQKFCIDDHSTDTSRIAAYIREQYPHLSVINVFPALAKSRMIKSDKELEFMKSAQISVRKAIEELLAYARPGMNECELEGMFSFALAKQKVRETAFPTIVAGGKRGTILHYQENCQPVYDGELVLIDLGSTCCHYCSDISRTFPINGIFTSRQRELYEIVLQAQKLVIQSAAPGKTLKELDDIVVQFYEKALPEAGLLHDGKTVRDYYYHGVSHPLGLDTHDICLPEYETLCEGMVITVEPGLYVEEEGIGIRIEDDLLITAQGAVNLSEHILKTPDEIEAFMKSRK